MKKNKKGISNWELVIRALALLLPFIFSSCSISKQISKQANTILLKDTAISSGHIGISIYEPATNKYWYNYDATKYFIPASNTKLFTLYAGMKYLGDSLVGAMVNERLDGINIYGTGDPTFLHPDYNYQPVFDYLLSKKNSKLNLARKFTPFNSYSELIPVYGNGWSWNDYGESYMSERNFFPIYGNVVKFSIDEMGHLKIIPKYFQRKLSYFNTEPVQLSVTRERDENSFVAAGNLKSKTEIIIPFKTGSDFGYETRYIANTVDSLLSDTLGIKISYLEAGLPEFVNFKKIHSQPTDSLFKPMMHRSDNFFAEQTLLMASNEHLGFMNDEKIIDTILKLDLKDISQRPKWVDGSGLSRYNLFTPKNFVYILNKMKNEFGLERMKNILPTGGEGTLSYYYKKDAGFIYAKTGTLSNNCAISGYLITHKGKLLIFSVLTNNYITGATPVRKAVEQFLQQLREKY
jgi:serine-type D-Ala-D-Ala carboxypeptidase/endopeptidase (penicillin-binding protein 4)